VATSSYAKALLGSIPADMKASFGKVMEYIFEGNLRFGPIEHQKRAENFAGVYLDTTTATVADDEFNVAHGLGGKPRVMWQVLDPQALGAKVVRLEVSRIADERRIYLRSPEAGAAITLYVEA
jgi:hypothetical protein